MQEVGYILKKIRIENGFTQEDICKAAGVGKNALINLENGRGVSPTTIRKVKETLYRKSKEIELCDLLKL